MMNINKIPENISDIDFDNNEDIVIDFSSLKSLRLNEIQMIADIQKTALLNDKKLKFKNVSSEISEILLATGFGRIFFENSIISKPQKRLCKI